MRVALVGGTGLVGSLLAARLLANGHELHLLQRRAAGGAEHPLRHVHVAPGSEWPAIVRSVAPDAAVSALGTTMKLAGSQAAFRAVDHDLVLAFASAARASGARRMATISSVGADPRSPNFYLRLKGEAEAALAALGFSRLDILQPGLLRGSRSAERRLAERIGIVLSPVANLFLQGPLARYAAIDAEIVAQAAAAAVDMSGAGVHRHENPSIRHLAKR